jgi:predicted nucleotidyltransferase
MKVEPVEAVRGIWRERYAGARVVLLAGSVLRGEATPASDLDLVVVYERLPHAWREAFVSGGWPVEAFVHDPETLNHFFEVDRRRAIPALMRMVIEGVEIPEPSHFSARIKKQAAEMFEAGPPRWTEDDIRLMRYRLTDWLDDLRHPRSPDELIATGAYLYGDVADFFLRSRGLWAAHSKTIPRRLLEVDASFAERCRHAFESLFAGRRAEPVHALVEEMLAPFGGLLFDGFHRDALPEERVKNSSQ